MKDEGISPRAGMEACRRFKGGHVEGASLTFAPSLPEFLTEARLADEMYRLRTVTQLTPPERDGSDSRMTGKEYAAKAIAYGKAQGRKGTHPIIRKNEYPREWQDWLDYFDYRGLWFPAEMMETHAAKGEGHTVPAISPYDFDPEFRR